MHLQVWAGRNRAAMAAAFGMAEETYRHLETTGERGRLSASRYDAAHDRWIAWSHWAAPLFHLAPDRLLAARHNTYQFRQVQRAELPALARA